MFIIDVGIAQKLELTLKLTLDSTAANVISAWENGTVRVGDTWYPGHLILTPETIIKNWQVTRPENLQLSHLESVISLDPEIIIVGTGMQLIFPNTKLTKLLAEKKNWVRNYGHARCLSHLQCTRARGASSGSGTL